MSTEVAEQSAAGAETPVPGEEEASSPGRHPHRRAAAIQRNTTLRWYRPDRLRVLGRIGIVSLLVQPALAENSIEAIAARGQMAPEEGKLYV
jgi:hypothetical protein